MLVSISVRRLDNDRIEIEVARPQHDSTRTHNYASDEEVRAVLSDFGMSEETITSHLKFLAKMGASEQLRFPAIFPARREALSLHLAANSRGSLVRCLAEAGPRLLPTPTLVTFAPQKRRRSVKGAAVVQAHYVRNVQIHRLAPPLGPPQTRVLRESDYLFP
jgi:hypothetical protein